LAVAAFSAGAGPPNGIEQVEGSFDWPEEGWYVPCLNDTLHGTVYYTMRAHSFDTPSGNSHWIESFYGVGYIYSKTTGNTWTQRFKFPINGNVKLGKGETYKLLATLVYVPDEGDGPLWFEEFSVMIVVNANGELKVERESPPGLDFGDRTRCAGKPN
jgi:hypothetical protein